MTKGCEGKGDWSEESNMMVRFKLTDLQSVQGVIASKLYNRNLSISNFQGNLSLKSFIIKDNDIYSMIILC